MSSPVALLSVAAVVVAGAAFLFTGHDEEPAAVATPVVASTSAAPTSTAPAPVVEQKPP
jgi:hypothetical protein